MTDPASAPAMLIRIRLLNRLLYILRTVFG